MEKIQSITVIAGTWFDKVNGNSYFSGKVLVNGKQAFIMPFQYGYGSHYQDVALQELEKRGIISFADAERPYRSLYMYCKDHDIALDTNMSDNWKQRDLKNTFKD